MPTLDYFVRGAGETSPFNLVNHTPDAGGSWSIHTGGNFIVSPNNYARLSNSSTLSIAQWTGDTGIDNYEAAVEGFWRSAPGGSVIAVCTRLGSDAGVMHRMYASGANFALDILDAFGSYTGRALLANASAIKTDNPYLIVGTCNGTTFTTSVKDLVSSLWLTSAGTFTSSDRVAALTATITHSSARGRIGIHDYAGATDTTGSSFDAVYYGEVGTLGVAPPTPVTTYTVTGPPTCSVGQASSDVTVTLGTGVLTGTAVVTISAGGGGGTLSSSSVSLTNSNRTATVTYTASSAGVKTISFTNDGGLTDPAALSVTASADQAIYCDSSSIIASPTNWRLIGTSGSMSAETVWPGSYMRLRFNGTAIAINVNTTGLSAYPWVLTQVDSGNPAVAKLTAGQTVINITGLTAGDHELNVIYQAKDNYDQAGTWGDSQKLVITSFRPSGGTGILASPTARPKKAIIYGDSIAAGLAVTAPPGVSTAVNINAATASYANHIGVALNAEFDQAGCGGDGWTVGGVGGFPALPSGWNLKKPGVPRSLAAHDYVVVIHGYNDGATDIASSVITNWITAVRATTTAWIFICVPFSGRQRGAITTGVANYIAANPSETKVKVIDLGSTFYQSAQSGYYTTDGIHPNSWQGGRLAAAYVGGMVQHIGTGAAVAAPTYRGGFRRV